MQVISFNEIQTTKTQWIWAPYFPLGKITIVQGDPGEGKTTLMLSLAAMLSRGRLPHVDDVEYEPFEVLYVNAEDGYGDTIKPRLECAGADCAHIHTFSEDIYDEPLTLDDHRLEGAIRGLNARLVILDPLQAFLGSKVDMHRANEIRPVMKKLAEIAENNMCAIVLIGHMNKAQGMKAAYRGLGSIDITAAARSVILVAKDNSNPDVRIMAQIKNSLAPIGKTLGFKMVEGGIVFLGEYNCNVDDLLLGLGNSKEMNEAVAIVKHELAQEMKPTNYIMEKLNHLQLNDRKIRELREMLKIQAVRKDGKWFWKM